ncbi:hypothetical protein [Deinococcus depolymerans]|uniref:Uncharacterized protein n=1 Tax=Deinococcus depolymerans TaxID=392408 RepID=A0ABN1BPI5_9DEIO
MLKPARPALLLLCLTACSHVSSPPEAARPRPLGLIELTVSGLGGPVPLSSVRAVATPGWRAQSLANQSDGLQLEPLNVTVFNTGTRGADGQRYVSAAYRVRNAGSDGTPSARPRSNLTLIAVSAGDTVNTTAFRAVTTFSGAPVPASVPRTMLPTHAMRFDPLTARPVLSAGAEDLQVFTEAEIASGSFLPVGGGAPLTYTDLGVQTVFPYGFTVHALNGGRTLAANPAPGAFDGRVTFSVRLPLQASNTQDPWAFRVVLLVTEDSATRVTQAPEEQALGNALVTARAATTGASLVNTLPGSTYAGAVPARCVNEVRTGGLSGTPDATYLIRGAC